MSKIGIFILICIICLFGGCAMNMVQPHVAQGNRTYMTIPAGSYTVDKDGTYHYINYEFEIVSDPAGMVIEWNNVYIGETPLKFSYNEPVRTNQQIVLKAISKIPGKSAKQKIIRNPIPRKIIFR